MKTVIWIVVGLFALIMLVGWSEGQKPGASEKSSMRHAIDYCWQQQGRKSLDPSAARFAAQTCEGMESEFVRKYGHKP